MATTDYSMFGGSALPEELQRQLLEDRAAKYAALTPEQRVAQGTYESAYGVGQGLAKAMGVDIQDPKIKRMTELKALSEGIPNTAEGMMQYAERLRATNRYPVEAAQAMDKAREIAKIEAETGLKGAQAEKARNFEAASADATKKRKMVATVEADLASGKDVDPVRLNEAKLAAKEYAKPRMVSNGAGGYDVLPGIDLTDFPNLGKVITSGGGAVGGSGGGSNVSTMGTALSEENKRNRLSGLEGSSAQLQTTLDTITQTEGLIGNKTTGWGSYLSVIPTSDAMTLADNTDTIKASVALTKLKEMKQESKTGASGLGALNMKELETIQGILGKLNPKSANYPTDLKKVKDFFIRAQKAMDEEVRLTKGGTPQQQRPAAPQASGSPDVAPKPSAMSGRNPQLQPAADGEALIQRNMAANKGYSREQVIANLIAAKKLPADYK